MIVLLCGILGAVVFFGLVSVFLLHKLFIRQQSKYLRNVPGPKPNPVFGNMLYFAVPTYEFFGVVEKLIEAYGSIFQFYDGPLSKVVLVLDDKLVDHILSSNQFLEKSLQYNYFHKWLGTGLLTSKGAKWKERRRLLTPAFHFSILENFLDVFDKVSNIFIQKLEEEVDKKYVNIYPMVSLYALDVICEAAMGISINAQNDNKSEYVKSVKKMCSIITDRNFSALDTRLYPFTINSYREKIALKVLHSHTDSVINKKIEDLKNAREDKTADKISDVDVGIKRRMAFLDLLLQCSVNGKPLGKSDIREEVDTFMFEGHDTTSSALSFALYSLANNPEAQEKAYKEQMSIFNGDKKAKATSSNLQEMRYLELCIKETLRLYPSVPLFARKVAEDFEWDKSIFPKGLQLIIFPYMIHRNPNFYPKPLEFIPERFLDYDGKNPYRYIPFSAGPRNCIGQKFAMLEIKSTLSKVLRNFELLPASPNVELKLAPEIILVSKSGVNIALKKRE